MCGFFEFDRTLFFVGPSPTGEDTKTRKLNCRFEFVAWICVDSHNRIMPQNKKKTPKKKKAATTPPRTNATGSTRWSKYGAHAAQLFRDLYFKKYTPKEDGTFDVDEITKTQHVIILHFPEAPFISTSTRFGSAYRLIARRVLVLERPHFVSW